jgi:hypothetical protein
MEISVFPADEDKKFDNDCSPVALSHPYQYCRFPSSFDAMLAL